MWWGGKLGNSILSFLEDEKPDIICLQEAVSFDKGDPGPFLSIEQIKKSTGLSYISSAPAFSFKLMHGSATFVNCIISRYPIVATNTVYTNLEHNKNFNFDDHDYNIRNLLDCKIEFNNDKFHVLTHHGHHVPNHKSGNEHTVRQMKMIADYIDELSGPIILTGDFNLAPNSESLELINDKLTNLSIKHKLSTTRTPLTNKKEVCDYIFINDQIRESNFEVSERVISDHAALILDFDILKT
jgi:endonuclease/exonuclease/phosphatase family metal-dependent hydrolase